jgi:hypothetical protein
MTNGPEFERLESHLRGSWLVRTIDASATAWRVAATRSAIVRALRSAITRFSSLAPADRLRAVAAFSATATIVHLLLLSVVPAHIAPALPQAVWVLVALTALVVAIAAKAVTNAWKSSFRSPVAFRAAFLIFFSRRGHEEDEGPAAEVARDSERRQGNATASRLLRLR